MPISTGSDGQDLTGPLSEAVQAAFAASRPLAIVGGGTKAFLGRPVAGEALELAGHRGVIAYDPGELVITARAGTPLAEIEALLAAHGQALAFEPPLTGAASTLGGVVAAGLSGPARPFAGAVRDQVLGVTILDGRGRRARLGGTVFKNVAGFDAFRPMAGALGTLGVLLDVSLRVAPRAAVERTVRLELDWPAARARLAGLLRRASPLSAAAHAQGALHLRFSGSEAGVAEAVRAVGGEADAGEIWGRLRAPQALFAPAPRLWRLSLPRLSPIADLEGEFIRDWAGAQLWLASAAAGEAIRRAARAAGGHATLFRGAQSGEAVFEPLAPELLALHRRLKAAFDPAGILNPGRMYDDV